MRKLKWTDSEDLAILLSEQKPQIDPLTVRFTDLHAWVCALPEFGDDPKNSNEKKLEAIQMAWNEEYNDRRAEDEHA
ncbi:MAG: Fe-S cluster assembly protein IscX [Phycisphaerae bacterium]|nr:Fe-S cluster assembly protein IscX [Phycisphaerae bacterium]